MVCAFAFICYYKQNLNDPILWIDEKCMVSQLMIIILLVERFRLFLTD